MLMWMHTFTHAIHYEWFIKTDTDTYVFVTNLRIYLKQYKPFEDLYLGHTVEHNGGFHHYASGGLYMISQSTLQKLGLILDTPKCQKKQGGIEDVRFASCMMNNRHIASNNFGQQRSRNYNASTIKRSFVLRSEVIKATKTI